MHSQLWTLVVQEITKLNRHYELSGHEVQLPFSKTSCVQTHLLPKSEIVEMRDLTENIGVKAFSTFLHFEGQA